MPSDDSPASIYSEVLIPKTIAHPSLYTGLYALWQQTAHGSNVSMCHNSRLVSRVAEGSASGLSER